MNHLIRKIVKNKSGQYFVMVTRLESPKEWEIEKVFYDISSARKYIAGLNEAVTSSTK